LVAIVVLAACTGGASAAPGHDPTRHPLEGKGTDGGVVGGGGGGEGGGGGGGGGGTARDGNATAATAAAATAAAAAAAAAGSTSAVAVAAAVPAAKLGNLTGTPPPAPAPERKVVHGHVDMPGCKKWCKKYFLRPDANMCDGLKDSWWGCTSCSHGFQAPGFNNRP
jgi:hypothetical protein